jgi:solute:Na+ symporter, SSS family
MPEVQTIQLPDYLVILAYFAVIVVAGLTFGSRIRKAQDYFAAGSSMPWWLAGTSFYKASFSASMFVIYSEIAYKYGIVAVVICWLSPVGFLIGSYFTARLWRRARVMTPLGFMERRFSPLVHQVSVWTGLPLRVFDNSLRILATAIIFAVALRGLGLSTVTFMIIIGVVMVLYSFLGGQLSVMITDFVNVSILLVAVVTLFVMTLGRVGNLGQFVRRLPPGFLDPLAEPYGWSYMVFTVLLLAILTMSASWSLVQKFNTLKSEREIRRMTRWVAFQAFLMPPIFFFPGLAARVLLPEIANAKEVYALISFKLLPVGLMGFVLSAVISATMSSLGSEFNTLSGVLTRDFFMKKIKPGLTEKEQVFWGRTFTAVIGAVTVAMAVVFNKLQGFNLLDIMFRLFSAFGPAIMLPLIAGLFSRKVNARGALAGIVAGAVTGVTLVVANIFLVQAHAAEMAASPRLEFWLRSGWNSAATVLNVAATILGMWLGSRSKPAAAEEKARSEEFFADLAKPFLLEEKGGKAQAPLAFFRIIGLMLLAFGLAIAAVALVVLLHYHNANAFRIDLIIAGALMAMGILMQLGKKEQPA